MALYKHTLSTLVNPRYVALYKHILSTLVNPRYVALYKHILSTLVNTRNVASYVVHQNDKSLQNPKISISDVLSKPQKVKFRYHTRMVKPCIFSLPMLWHKGEWEVIYNILCNQILPKLLNSKIPKSIQGHNNCVIVNRRHTQFLENISSGGTFDHPLPLCNMAPGSQWLLITFSHVD